MSCFSSKGVGGNVIFEVSLVNPGCVVLLFLRVFYIYLFLYLFLKTSFFCIQRGGKSCQKLQMVIYAMDIFRRVGFKESKGFIYKSDKNEC